MIEDYVDFHTNISLPVPVTKSFGVEDFKDPYLDSYHEEPKARQATDCTDPGERWVTDDESSQALQQGVRANMAVNGVLTLHFQDRDLEVPLHGYAALRALANIERGTEEWTDLLNPFLSDARSGWVAIRTERLLGATWRAGTKVEGGFVLEPAVA